MEWLKRLGTRYTLQVASYRFLIKQELVTRHAQPATASQLTGVLSHRVPSASGR